MISHSVELKELLNLANLSFPGITAAPEYHELEIIIKLPVSLIMITRNDDIMTKNFQ